MNRKTEILTNRVITKVKRKRWQE